MREEINVEKNLKNKLMSLAGQTIYQRGNKYFRDNLVSNVHFADEDENKIEIIAEVSGNDEYEVCLDFTDSELVDLRPMLAYYRLEVTSTDLEQPIYLLAYGFKT